MKKIYGILIVLFVFLTGSMTVVASGQTARPVVALGADLSAEQRATVLQEMGLTEETLANCTVITITNAQEHQYLDAYIDPAVIGTKSLSSVMLTPGEKDSGVLVTTKNINYCTTGMYRNALMTAGLKDTSVLVVAPSPMSGTAGLIGAIKSYEDMYGVTISDSTIDASVNEMITTGELSVDSANGEEMEELVAFIKAKIASGELQTDDDIRNAIKEGEDKFKVSLTDEEINQIIEVMQKIKELGLDPEALLTQAQDLYKKFGDELISNTEEVVKQSIGNSFKNFFVDMGDRVKTFFTNLF